MNLQLAMVQALQNVAPGAQWALSETDLSTLQWLDPSVPRPLDSTILTEFDRLVALPDNVPVQVGRMQAMVALERAGLLAAVTAWVTTQSAEVQLIWAHFDTLRRDSALVRQAQQALNLTTTQVDTLFIAAAAVAP